MQPIMTSRIIRLVTAAIWIQLLVQRDTVSGQDPSENNGSTSQNSDNRTIRKGGAIYTRWGRTECEGESTELVYAGVAGGSHHTHAGSGSDYMCMPMDPQFSNYDDTVRNLGIVYGAEYEVNVYSPFEGITTEGVRTLHDQNVPCAVCRSMRAATVMMIPARKDCYAGWNAEYRGYLMTEHHGHQRTKHVCVDTQPEADPAGFRDENGALFYPVEGACGSLPCPPYVAGRELVCVVCTK